MADPITLVAVVATLVSATASLATYTKSFQHAIPELERQIAEVDVLLLILQETTTTFIDFGSLPKSVLAATKRCEQTYAILKEILDRMAEREKRRSKTLSIVKKNLRIVASEERRRAAYHAFRDSVLLLRDLASDAKLQIKLGEMSAGMVELLGTDDFDDESIGDDSVETATIETKGADRPKANTTWDPKAHADQKGVSLEDLARAKKRNTRHERPLMHADSNFTMDVTLVLRLKDSRGLQYIPLRAKMDTGCDHNLISMDILRRENIENDQIEVLEEEIELTGLEGTTYTLKKKITFTWYLKRNMKSRVGDFYIVEDESFDMILGALFWGGSGGKSALFLHRPWKSRRDRRKEKVDHAANVASVRAAEEVENREDLEARLKKRLLHAPTPSQPPATGSSSGVSNANTATASTGSSLPAGTSSQAVTSSQTGASNIPGGTQSAAVP